MKYEHLPEGWRLVQLQDVFERIQRPIENDVENVLSITATVGFVDQAEKFGRVIAGKNLERYILLRRGEFAYNKGNSDSYPQGCIYMLEEFEQGAVPNVYYCFGAKSEWIYSEFYKYYFESGLLNSQLQRLINSGVRNDGLLNLPASDFFRVFIPLPPIDEQCRIAEVLHDADANLAHVEAQIESAQDVKRGVIQRLFTYGLAVEGTPTKQTRIGEIPEHWHLSEVGKEFDVTSGFTFGPDRHPRQNKYKYLRVANVQREFINLDVLAELEATPDEIAAKSLLEGDILAVEGHANPLEIGRCALVTSDAVGLTFQNHLFRLRSRTVEPRYAIAWLNSTWMGAYWEKHSRTSSGLHTINRSMLNEVPFPVPTGEEQREIAVILSDHDAAIRNLQAEAESLREVKRGLMQKLLSGEVRV